MTINADWLRSAYGEPPYSALLDQISILRGALSKIADRTGERMRVSQRPPCGRARTKAALEAAIDAIGLIASEALVRASNRALEVDNP